MAGGDQGKLQRPENDFVSPERHSDDESEHDDANVSRREAMLWARYDASNRAGGFLVDAGPIGGQLSKAEFLERLRGAVEGAIEDEIGVMGATAGCPYLDKYFSKYQTESAATTEATLRRWLPRAAQASSATELIPLVVERVREAARVWNASGRLPADVAAIDPGLAAEAERRPAGSLDSMEAQLGPGRPLDGTTATRMSAVVGADVSGAKIHNGPTAQQLAAQHDATAFTVGQNVVLGASAPTQGVEADALLAHELAHTAQQKQASTETSERKKPIGEEDPAAERAAGLERLNGFAGALGDVMRTGLQLQRCPDKMPAGPPMSGKEADRAIERTPEVADYIHNDILQGITGEKLVRFHDNFDDYVKAWHDDSLPVQSLYRPGLKGDDLEKAKWELARELAKAPGFTNPQTHVVHVYKDAPRFVTIHEMMHAHTAAAVFGLGEVFVEGSADYFTQIVCAKNDIPFGQAYGDQLKLVKKLASVIGDSALARVTFHGEIDVARTIVDSKGPGTWKKYVEALKRGNEDETDDLLKGVVAANEAREHAEAEEQRKRDDADKQKREQDRAKDRATWPEEATHPITGQVVNLRMDNGKPQVGISVGGRLGVREGWIAHLKLSNGSAIDSNVVEVLGRVSYVELPDMDTAKSVVSAELRPSHP